MTTTQEKIELPADTGPVEPGLTDDEREALEISDEEERAGDVEPDPKEEPSRDEPEEGETDDEPEDADEGEAEPEKPAPKADPAPKDDEPEPLPEPARAYLKKPDLPDDPEAELKAIEAKRDALAKRFDDGEISSSDYRREDDKLADQRADLKADMRDAKRADEHNAAQDEAYAENMRRAWGNDVRAWLKDHPEVDVSKPAVLQSLDATVRAVEEDPAHARVTNRQKLDIAYAKWRADLGLPALGDKKTPTPKTRGTKLTDDKLPPTLGRVPAADAADPETGGRGQQLDRLARTNPAAYEAELARMDENDPYLKK